jgi:hypothetical protein
MAESFAPSLPFTAAAMRLERGLVKRKRGYAAHIARTRALFPYPPRMPHG